MKKIVLLMLSLVMTTMAMAEGLTPEEALEQARSFMQKREAAGSRMRKSPAALHLTMTQRVSGLYVFNVANDGGFVIVSNDDRTTPILGFSDSGSIDVENMPENMRAWLQGYADEIAWLQEHNVTTTAAARGQRRVGSHSTNSIEPLVQTKWNQGSPYNNLCPEYSSGHRAVTGCVATAMAQVMYYTETKAGNNTTTTTTAIPAYTTYSYSIPMSAIPSGTSINWSAMTENYGNSSTPDAKQAVAQLMLYCGSSVGMNYGPSSAAGTSGVPEALTTYFGYKETAQFVQRKLYSEAKWVDLMYFELAHQRPVLYSGQSSGGGHAFVCDGYKYENGTDFFHINWGWGGLSDDYFVLSALDPDHQGIGGSSSTDGYCYDQDAVIGIQKSTDNGQMSSIQQNNIDLQLNSMTLSSTTIPLGESVTITLNITNNSEDDFEEDELHVARLVGNSYYLIPSDYFSIPAGQTQNCAITYTPAEIGTHDLIFNAPNNNGGYWIDGVVRATLTVVPVGAPINISSDDVTSTSAVLSWTATGSPDGYKVRYRTMATGFQDGFESGLGNWTIYTEGESPGMNGWNTSTPNSGAHGGNWAVSSWSYSNVAYNANNWLVTPQVALGGTLSFWELTNSGYPDSYEVLLSTTGKAIEDFTITLRPMQQATGSWSEVSIDLSAYAGLKGYIAIHHVSYDCNYLFIDDFTVGPVAAAGEWGEQSTTGTSLTLTGLASNTDYEYQVVGIKGGSELVNPEIATFTTLGHLELADDDSGKAENSKNSALVGVNNGLQRDVTLQGRTFKKNGDWHTICLPFDVTLANSPLAGATAKTLSTATMTGTTVNLTFGSSVTTLQAGVPYIIKWTTTGADIVSPTFTNVTINNSAEAIARQTVFMAGGNVKFIGYYDAFGINTPANDDIYYMTAGNTLKHTGKPRTLNACRAYFQFTATNGVRQIILNFDDESTSISEAGKVKSEASGLASWYSIDGVRLNSVPTKKGVYIQNGRKVVIK